MRKKFSLLLVLVLLAGVVGLAGTARVEPRVVGSGVWLFDNETGGAITKLVILFDRVITLEASDIIAIGGGEAEEPTVREIPLSETGSYSMAKIEVEVVAGGTLQVTLRGDSADAQVVDANTYWLF